VPNHSAFKNGIQRPELRERGIATESSRFQQPGFARELLKINMIFHDCVSPQQINDDIAALMLAEPPSLFAQINVNPLDQLALWLVPSSYSSFDYSFAVHQLNRRCAQPLLSRFLSPNRKKNPV
jgi:hypothetical protein